MREIKFRGYAVEEMCDGQWVYGTGIHRTIFSDEYASKTGKKEEWFILTEHGFVKVHKESIGQFTGLHDKHETPQEVWENDIIFDPISNKFYAVEYDELGAMYLFFEVSSDDGCGVDYYEFEDISSFWIVCGNIFEDPKLLEETE